MANVNKNKFRFIENQVLDSDALHDSSGRGQAGSDREEKYEEDHEDREEKRGPLHRVRDQRRGRCRLGRGHGGPACPRLPDNPGRPLGACLRQGKQQEAAEEPVSRSPTPEHRKG